MAVGSGGVEEGGGGGGGVPRRREVNKARQKGQVAEKVPAYDNRRPIYNVVL